MPHIRSLNRFVLLRRALFSFSTSSIFAININNRTNPMKYSHSLVSTALLCLLALTQTAHASVITVNQNFDSNLDPAGDWSLSVSEDAGIENDRLQAVAINGSALLSYTLLPASLEQIDITYRGFFGSAYSTGYNWGTFTAVGLVGLPLEMSHGVNTWTHGNNNYAQIAGSHDPVTINPINPSVFDYVITATDGHVTYSATDTNDGSQAFSLSYADAGIALDNITALSFRTHNTTGINPVWLDDIELQFRTATPELQFLTASSPSPVPVPAAVWLFGTALIGLVGFSKRRARIAA
jgi:hypothetical protein